MLNSECFTLILNAYTLLIYNVRYRNTAISCANIGVAFCVYYYEIIKINYKNKVIIRLFKFILMPSFYALES